MLIGVWSWRRKILYVDSKLSCILFFPETGGLYSSREKKHESGLFTVMVMLFSAIQTMRQSIRVEIDFLSTPRHHRIIYSSSMMLIRIPIAWTIVEKNSLRRGAESERMYGLPMIIVLLWRYYMIRRGMSRSSTSTITDTVPIRFRRKCLGDAYTVSVKVVLRRDLEGYPSDDEMSALGSA